MRRLLRLGCARGVSPWNVFGLVVFEVVHLTDERIDLLPNTWMKRLHVLRIHEAELTTLSIGQVVIDDALGELEELYLLVHKVHLGGEVLTTLLSTHGRTTCEALPVQLLTVGHGP